MFITDSTIKNLHLHLHMPIPGLTVPFDLKDAALQAFEDPGARICAPAIGQRWPGVQGVYSGVARGEDGAPDEHLVLLDVRPSPECLAWGAGMEWAASLGNGAHVPTPAEGALLYAHVREHLNVKKLHWLGKQAGSGSAWGQLFNYGDQSPAYGVAAECAVRAVRRFAL